LRRNAAGKLESVWPARFPTEALLKKRTLLGPSKFGAEYMNDPRDPETQIFNPNNFTYYQPVELLGKELKKFLFVDPSKGRKGKGRKNSDFSGFAEGYADQAGRVLYITNAFRKRLAPAAAKAEVTEWYLKALANDPDAELWVEANSFGSILGEQWQDELRKKGADREVKTLNHSTEKEARLERLSIRVESAGVRFPAKWEPEDRRPEWFVEFEDFPAAANDDTIDAIESLDSVAFTSVEAAGGGTDPEGETARDRAKIEQEKRFLSRLRSFGRRRAA
jgi:predicted phage terminase large subunit-like protein